jgi:uncharacterized protein HemY
MAVVGFLSAVKALTERVTQRWIDRRKRRRARRAAEPGRATAAEAAC